MECLPRTRYCSRGWGHSSEQSDKIMLLWIAPQLYLLRSQKTSQVILLHGTLQIIEDCTPVPLSPHHKLILPVHPVSGRFKSFGYTDQLFCPDLPVRVQKSPADVSQWRPAAGLGALSAAVCAWDLFKEVTISPEYSLEGLILKLKLQYFGHLM